MPYSQHDRDESLAALVDSHGWRVWCEMLDERLRKLERAAVTKLNAPEEERWALKTEYEVLTRIRNESDYGLKAKKGDDGNDGI